MFWEEKNIHIAWKGDFFAIIISVEDAPADCPWDKIPLGNTKYEIIK